MCINLVAKLSARTFEKWNKQHENLPSIVFNDSNTIGNNYQYGVNNFSGVEL